MKEKAKESMSKKRSEKSKSTSKDLKKSNEKSSFKEKNEEGRNELNEVEETGEEKTDKNIVKRSESSDAIGSKSIPKPKSILKKSDISFNAFKNCSKYDLKSFMEQMGFIKKRSSQVFLKACKNLCEIEVVKEYDSDINLINEKKYIKLKDSVLKDYISKTAKESSADQKNLNLEKKDLGSIQTVPKSGSLTSRSKGQSNSNQNLISSKDPFLVSSLKSTKEFFEKPNRHIIIIILDKIVDKY